MRKETSFIDLKQVKIDDPFFSRVQNVSLEELTEENKRLQEENERLKNRSIKERMYDKINVSVRTIDIFIGCMCVLFVAVVVMGMLK